MKGLLKFITCGSVDDGKSTLIGHILYDSKLLYADQEKALELDSKVGSRSGKIDYSLLLDGLMAEREQGITIDVAYRYFTTDNRSFIVADTPGHEEYTRNMAVGASFADLAVILVDASQGVLVQTRRHARICRLMGIRHFVFAVNKMDLVAYSEDVFKRIQGQIAELAQTHSLDNIQIIPLSATEGDNVTTKSKNIPWYNGPALLEYLETVDTANTAQEQGFYLPVQRVSRPDRTFRGFQGQIESGKISVGEKITALPNNEHAVVKRILVAGRDVESATIGQPVSIVLDREIDISRGSVIERNSDLGVYKKITASILWMDDAELSLGTEYLLKLGTKVVPAVITKIDYTIDVNSGEYRDAETLSKNGLAVCEITLAEPIVASTFATHKTLGELILIDRVSHATSACGIVEALSEKQILTGEKAAFVQGERHGRGEIFEEFFYDTATLSVVKQQPVQKSYTVGEEIPTVGESYHYPDDFDIIILRDSVAVKVRGKRIAEITGADKYLYDGFPVINGRGFEIKVNSDDDVSRLLNEYADAGESGREEFFRKWTVFDTYRKVVIH
jgi:sulfate adenylyltransferase subunit 1